MVKKKYDLLVIAGTYDSYELIERLKKYNISILATVTTLRGKELLSNLSIDVLVGRLNKENFKNIICDKHIKCILDSSHPYAQEVTQTITEVSSLLGIPYVRYLRPSETNNLKDVYYTKDSKSAAQLLCNMKGNIFLTTGTKDLKDFVDEIVDYKSRLFIRVLPALDSIKKCEELEIPMNNIIAMMGHFSIDINKELLKYYKANILVTKDGGKIGGFYEKVTAAKELGLNIVIIKRPLEFISSVSTYEEAIRYVLNKIHSSERSPINA